MNKKIIFVVFVIIFIGSFSTTILILDSNKYNFSAQSVHGKVSLDDFNGMYKIIYFGYTFCPDVCPLSLNILQEALDGIDTSNIKLLFISLDPKRDTPQNLQEYVSFFYPNSLGLWIDEDNLRDVAKRFDIKYQEIPLESSALNYSIAHSSSLFLFDKNGKLVDRITNLTKENIRDSILKMIRI